MKTRSVLLAVAVAQAVGFATLHGHAAPEHLLGHAESRFRAIYDRDEFRPKRFQAEWLPDSSGYTVLEPVPGEKEPVRALYDVASGQRSVVDASRVAIWGWSGGGSNTLNAMFRRPDLYQVGIAVVPKPQPHLYNAWFQEIYMQTPETNPEGYRRSAPIHFAEGLKGNLLIIHGTGESNTHLQIVEGLVDRLIELGKRFDYMAYPNRDHGLREGRGTAVHLRTLMARYLVEHLPPGPH